MGSVFASLDKDDDVLVVGMNRAVEVLAKKLASVRVLGAHPAGGDAVMVRKGRFGPYAQHGSMVANLPRDVSMDDITLAAAVALLAERGKAIKAKGKPTRGKAGRAAKAKAANGAAAAGESPAKVPAERAPRPKAAAKKTAPKKTAAKTKGGPKAGAKRARPAKRAAGQRGA
jgi:DNA topoisomerase-1